MTVYARALSKPEATVDAARRMPPYGNAMRLWDYVHVW